jgi:hypothetical protein
MRGTKPTSEIAYFSHLKLIHKLRKLSTDTFKSFICKTQIRGAENLQFYNKEKLFPLGSGNSEEIGCKLSHI